MATIFRWSRIILVGALCLASTAQADRYFTWVDGQGRLRTTLIKEENPLKDRAEQVGNEQQSVAPSAAPNRSETGPQKEAEQDGAAEEAPPAQASPHPVFNLDNFPDGNELEKKGFLREGEASPFYTWTDATGTVHNTPFNPAREISAAKQEKQAASGHTLMLGNEAGFSEALTVRREAGLPAGADRQAAAVLGLKGEEPALIAIFARSCCDEIEKQHIHALDPERGTSLRIAPDAPVHDFATGRSPYRIVELPQRQESFSLRLRSFVENGVFLPTLVFLDKRWQPVRLVTDIDFNYEPESWYRYGYLQALLPVEPQEGERWMLVLSKSADLDDRAVFTDEESAATLKPSRSGELELTLGNNAGSFD